jgi:tRNA/tmRNA/rRNA uracil-C5-methylase (TrmA/RlmC/RlmD family)
MSTSTAGRRQPLPRQPVEAVIDGFTHGGEGVARIEGKAVFVAGTIPGERVRVRVTDDRKRWARADLLEVLEPAVDRVTPPCPYVPDCGGCDLQHIAPDAQRRLKTQVVVEQLQRLGGLTDPAVQPCRAVGPDVGYRTHAQLHADDDGRLGFHRAGSHDVVPIDRCLVLTEATQAVRAAVGDDTGAVEVALRAHEATGTATAQLTPGHGPLELPDGGFDVVLTQPNGSTVALRGDGELAEEVDGLSFGFDASSFFQVTTHGAHAIVRAVLDAVGEVQGALVWDLYAGVGLLSLPLARAGAEVVAVEGHAPAAAHAVTNAATNNLDLEVLPEDVATMTARAAGPTPDRDPPDVVVLDPPRSGAGAQVIDDLARVAPASIVYVACDVAALARDTRLLVDRGYRLLDAVPLDLFPMTHHVEVVATFTR